MKTIIIIFVILITIIYFLRQYYEKKVYNELNFILDGYGSIQVLNSNGLLAVIYKDRTIDWMNNPSFIEIVKVKSIADRFEEHYKKLEEEQCQ